ncbi:MAG: hypothetical protein FJ115_04750 [Deltaproteobacteria bacterium]|nr:hypothetical protein [Deltaproteobacteria bacterium]
MRTQHGEGSELDLLGESGWIQLHRKLKDSAVFQNEGLLKVWIWCLLEANHKDKWVSVKTGKGTTEVLVKRGQFIFGRKSAAKRLRMKPSTIQGRMQKLVNMQNLVIKPVTHYSMITICNYELYQGDGRGDPSPKDYEKRLPHTLFEKASKTVTQNHAISPQFNEDSRRIPNNNPSPIRHPTVTNNKDNNEKKKKNSLSVEDFIEPVSASLGLVKPNDLFDIFWEAYPKKVGKKEARESWGKIKITRELLEKMLNTIKKFTGSDQWIAEGGRFIPHPATWLNQGRWDDEVTKPYDPYEYLRRDVKEIGYG